MKQMMGHQSGLYAAAVVGSRVGFYVADFPDILWMCFSVTLPAFSLCSSMVVFFGGGVTRVSVCGQYKSLPLSRCGGGECCSVSWQPS